MIRELREATEAFQAWDLVELAGHGYWFRVELLRRWIVQYKSLGRVQQELDYVQPLAENLYRAEEGFYKTGNMEEAVGHRQALKINPNHLRASELLAELLILREEWSEARRMLEGMYENHPVVARPRLIQVLLAEANLATGEDDALVRYDRVLALDEKNMVATAEKQRIWKGRGDQARSKGRLDEAIDAYHKAGYLDLGDKCT
ncbi:MAG: hypothetical protein U0359_28030 [Byssovorax sp.]